MKIQNTFITLFVIILLAVSPYGLPLSDHRLVLTDNEIDDSSIVRGQADLPSNDTDSSTTTTPETPTTATPTTTTTTSETTTTTAAPVESTTTTSSTPTSTSTASPTATTTTTESPTPPPTTTVAPISSTIITESPTTSAPGRKFDGLSFFGGIILAVGLGVLIYLVIGYLRRNNQLPYSNLR